jgi:hypothetical protein
MAATIMALRPRPGQARLVERKAPIPQDPEHGTRTLHDRGEVGLGEGARLARGMGRQGKGGSREVALYELAHRHGT